jgi:peptide/nickel transport system substrate-binding protein
MRTLLSVLALGLALSAAQTHDAGAADMPRRGGVLAFAHAGDPPSLDCMANVSFAALHVLAPHYSTLLRFDGATYPAIKPDLAESYEVAPDYLTYTFRLRPGVKFHDGTALTSEDARASYERLRNPPAGVISARRGSFEDIDRIETPDALTVVFRMRQPAASMLFNFASPWNCIYSAARLKGDPRWPEKNVMGTGPFRFVERVAGSHWTGARFEGYYDPAKPYLDGFKALIVSGAALINALQGGQVLADFRGIAPPNRDRLKQALGDRMVILESPWICRSDLLFNTGRKPFDDPRVRRALSIAIDRWQAAEALSKIATVRHVGGTMRPGSPLGASPAELERLPGFGHDIAAARAEARRLLKEAGAENLKFSVVTRNIPMPYTAVSIFVIDQWRQIGVAAENQPLTTDAQKMSYSSGSYEVGLDGVCEFMDDPDLQLLRFISGDRSPISVGHFIDRALDDLYERQKRATDPAERYKLLRAFDERLATEAYAVPIIWWHRIIAHWAQMKGWSITPSHYIGQDLADIWLDQ